MFQIQRSWLEFQGSYTFLIRYFHRIGPLGQFDLVVAKFVSVLLLSVCFSPFHVLDFAPTSRNQMSKIFKYSESLRKSAGKKWSQNLKFLLGSGLKSCKQKFFVVVADFALQNMMETTLTDGLEISGRRV